jgi:hypothetical protein
LDTQKHLANNDHEIQIFVKDDNNGFLFSHSKIQNDISTDTGNELKVFATEADTDILEKICRNTVPLEDVYEVKAGLKAYEAGKGHPRQTPDDVKKRIYDFKNKIDDRTDKYLDGKDVGRYWHKWDGSFLQFGENLAAPRELRIFSSPVIILREITGKHPKCLNCAYSDGTETLLFNMSNIAILSKNSSYELKFLLGILNSSLMSYYFMRMTPKSVRELFPKIILTDLRKFPIKMSPIKAQRPIIKAVDNILNLFHSFNSISDAFLNLIKCELKIDKIGRNLQTWHSLDENSFISALENDIRPHHLSLPKKNEWLQYFQTEKYRTLALKLEIDEQDSKIDQLVYALYGITTTDEIAVIENSK